MTVREALEGAARQLAEAGIANGRGEAEMLLGRLLSCTRAELFLRGGEEFDTGAARTLGLWLLRRAGGEPIQYVLGEAAYRDLLLEVGPGVFIPRPETELLVDDAPRLVRPGGLVALELGEGQGDTVRERFRAHGAYDDVRIRLDLAGRARMALARIGLVR